MSTVSQSAITSPELVMMQMMIENDEVQSQADKAARDSAREVQRQAMQDELEAIEDQASAIRTGALIEGGLQIAGGSLTLTGAVASAEAQAAPPAHEYSNEELKMAATNDDLWNAIHPPEASAWTVPSLQVGGQVATGLAQPAGKLFGEAAQTDAQHDAKAAAQQQQQASWLAEDAETHRQKVEKHAETVMQQVQGIVETQHQTTVAVLSNM